MSINNLTAVNQTVAVDATARSQVMFTPQGVGGNDFTWEVQYSLDNGTTWTPYQNTKDDTTFFTGSLFKLVFMATRQNRFILTSLGSATSVNVDIYT